MALEILTSDALSAHPHGFFTRRGGASSGIFDGLNCGYSSSDQSEIVTRNRASVAEALQIAPENLTSVYQVHSADVVPVITPFTDQPHADAMVTDRPGIALGILTADCQPVLFSDQNANIIGAAHAGWKGAQTGILEATIDAMEALGAKRENISAVIGPCISQRAYEVGPEFFASFVAVDPEYTRFFANGKGDRMMFDLPSFGLFRLRQAGVGKSEWIGHCTYSDPDRFFSYRRTTHKKEADYGRLISVIRL